MHSADSSSLSEAYNESGIAPHDGARHSFDERIRIAPDEARYGDRLRWARSNNRSAIKKRSIGKRMLYAATRVVVAVLIGVGATLGWQAYGDEARTRLASWDPALAWLTPPPAAQPVAVAALSAADLTQQLKPITLEIAALRQDVAQLATKQEQFVADEGRIAQGLAVIHSLEQDIGLKVSSLSQPKPVHAPPPHHPAQAQSHEPTQLQPHEGAQRAAPPPELSERR